MLHGGYHSLRLCAAHFLTRQSPRQQRILPEIFKIASIARVAGEIASPAEQHIEPFCARLAAHHGAAAKREFRIKTRGERKAGRHRRGDIAAAQLSWVDHP